VALARAAIFNTGSTREPIAHRTRFRIGLGLEAAAREEAEEQGSDIAEMDRINREMNRQTLLNMASQQFPQRVKQEPED